MNAPGDEYSTTEESVPVTPSPESDADAVDRNPAADQEEQERARAEAIAAAPLVALSIQSSGIHPSTSRMITVDVVTLSPEQEPVDTFHAVLNPGSDPGPFHLHGVTPAEFGSARRFGQILKTLDRLIDGRTLILHNTPRTWGFIVSEARRAMSDAARANRNSGRGNRRGGRGRRRQRVGHIPRPLAIIDTLASARRQSILLDDVRVRGVAATLGIPTTSAAASVARARRPHTEFCREETLLVAQLYARLSAAGGVAKQAPEELRADRFGLQRSIVRVAAQEAPRVLENPGVYAPGTSLIAGMEVVVAPEIEMDPDIIIAAVVEADLAYSEKLTRQTSVVVCNQTRDMDGKAMHAQRKGIPLLSDTAFMGAVERVKDGTPLP